jgi:predicted alpha/beta-hydrolase family hydrolase
VAAERISIDLSNGEPVSGLLEAPGKPLAGYVLAHGAGAGMEHPFMSRVARGLAERGIATLRYQFAYMERGSRRPDVPKVAHAAVRAAVAEAGRRWPQLPLLAGGKSFGGRMTSQAQAIEPLAGVVGLAFLGFPLHPAGKPAIDRAQHLADVRIPMLFVQGTRDDMADAGLLEPIIDTLRPRATLHWVSDGDHSFHVPAASGRSDGQAMATALDALRAWAERIVER